MVVAIVEATQPGGVDAGLGICCRYVRIHQLSLQVPFIGVYTCGCRPLLVHILVAVYMCCCMRLQMHMTQAVSYG